MGVVPPAELICPVQRDWLLAAAPRPIARIRPPRAQVVEPAALVEPERCGVRLPVLARPAADQRIAMSPSRQRFTFADRCLQTPIMDSMALIERRVRASVGGTPSRSTVRVSARPSAQAGGDPRVGLVQLAGQGLELRLGEQRTVGVVGPRIFLPTGPRRCCGSLSCTVLIVCRSCRCRHDLHYAEWLVGTER